MFAENRGGDGSSPQAPFDLVATHVTAGCPIPPERGEMDRSGVSEECRIMLLHLRLNTAEYCVFQVWLTHECVQANPMHFIRDTRNTFPSPAAASGR
jgi:hypothetical protein